MTKCMACGAEMKSTKETHEYTESGLPNVKVVGVTVNRCTKCDEVEIEIPRLESLHKAIAAALLRKGARLSGAEVRFLRSHLGYSGADFAKVIGVGPSTVSRWENDKEPIGPQADRLLRLMVLHREPQRDYDVDELGKMRDTVVPAKVRAKVASGGGWEASATT